MRWPNDSKLRSINRCLLVIIIVVNSFVLLSPLWPKLIFAITDRFSQPITINTSSLRSSPEFDRSKNHLVIPKLHMDEPILDGESESTVHRGIWRRPNAAKPGEGSNTVLVGHRFTYSGASVFYHLDKLAVGDDIVAIYNKKVFHYKVTGTRTVEPTETDVEAPTSVEKLTLYTCTPLGSLKYRLVIDTKLEETL